MYSSEVATLVDQWLRLQLNQPQMKDFEHYKKQLFKEITDKAKEVFKQICKAVEVDSQKPRPSYSVETALHHVDLTMLPIFSKIMNSFHEEIKVIPQMFQRDGIFFQGEKKKCLGGQFIKDNPPIYQFFFSANWNVGNQHLLNENTLTNFKLLSTNSMP